MSLTTITVRRIGIQDDENQHWDLFNYGCTIGSGPLTGSLRETGWQTVSSISVSAGTNLPLWTKEKRMEWGEE
jgi:hypothetical protein